MYLEELASLFKPSFLLQRCLAFCAVFSNQYHKNTLKCNINVNPTLPL